MTTFKKMYLMLAELKNDDGLTLKNYEAVTYKTGWQVADAGKETSDLLQAAKYIEEMNGNAGVWYSNGIYYIDHSFRVDTKQEALAIGRAHQQISILGWRKMNLVYC